MTGGTALILGEVGQNFAAGMSGGVAYVFDEYNTLEGRCNKEMVKIDAPCAEDLDLIRSLIEEHVRYTASPRGIKMLYRFDSIGKAFQEVIPVEYEHVLNIVAAAKAQGKPTKKHLKKPLK